MSIDFNLSKKVTARDLFCGRLATFEIREHVASGTSERRCLTDETNYRLSVYDRGRVRRLFRIVWTQRSPQDPRRDQRSVRDRRLSEHEPRYWGFDTQEELDAAWKRIDDQARDQFYTDVRAYIGGEPNDIKPGTIGETRAKIAKTLIRAIAALLQSENKDRLLAEMDAIYRRDHTVADTLGAEDIPF